MKYKNTILFIILFIISLIVLYLFFSLNKYINIHHIDIVKFNDVLLQFSYLRFLISIFISIIIVLLYNLVNSLKSELNNRNETINSFIKKIDTNENKFEDYANLLPEGLYETDLNGTLIFASTNLLKMFKYTKNDIIGKNIFKFINYNYIDKAKEQFNKNISNELSIGLANYVITMKDNQEKEILLHAVPTYDINDNINGTRGIIIDISDVNELKKNYEAQYNITRTIINTISLPLYVQNIRGEIIYYNKSFSNFINNNYIQIKDKTMFDIFDQEVSSKLYKKTTELMRIKDDTQSFSIKYNNQDFMVIQSKYINETDKYQSGIVGIIQDLSPIKLIKKELKISSNILQILMKEAIYGILIVHNRGIIYINDQVNNIIEYRNDEIILDPVFYKSIIQEKDYNKFINMLEAIKTQDHIRNNINLISKSGIIKNVDFDMKRINYNNENAFLVNIMNISHIINSLNNDEAFLEEITN